MANGPALSTAKRGEIYVGSTFRDSFSLLDVLHANEFEGESFDPELTEETEQSFYRGAPPNWLNFHFSEQAVSNGTGTSFIKRDGYQALKEEMQKKRKFPGIFSVKLFHQPGCGGTTTAMQVLWDLRKTFRCAVLRGSAPDITNVAKEVVHLFTAGNQGHQNTVLLLLDDEQILDNLQHSIMMIIAQQKLVTHMPVVVLLSCVRKDAVLESDHVVLQKLLSDKEKQQFNEKRKELRRRYGDRCKLFHGFNILQTNFSQGYVQEACEIFKTIKKTNKPLKTQLAAFLSLLNAYVPGSYLLESQCLDFLKHHGDIHEDFSLEDLMKPFTHLIITFQQDIRSERIVRMVHPLIARCCIELMDKAGVTRSDTARNFLTCFCKDEVPPWLLGFVKDMLTKRVMKKEENPVCGTDIKEEQERFSTLILDIQKMEGEAHSASVLKVASKRFDQNAFFPQALARFYYIELKKYNLAEMWAKRAKQRDPQSSFVADTLGQVHKNHLKSKELSTKPRKILQLTKKAIEAFKHEELLAEEELGEEMKDDRQTKVSNVFNSRGQFGYLQVCNILYDKLVSQNKTWGEVLTKNVSMSAALESLGNKELHHSVTTCPLQGWSGLAITRREAGYTRSPVHHSADKKLYKFNTLINSLRDEVERKCDFFDKYLTYSKLSMEKEDPEYISKDTSNCYRKYVGESPPKHMKQKGAEIIQKLKQSLAYTSVGVLSCLDREYTEPELKEITTWYGEICSSKDSGTVLVNYIFAHIMLMNTGVNFPLKSSLLTEFGEKMPLSPKDPPEQHMLALLLYWPDKEDKCTFDLNQLIQQMHQSYEHTYQTYFRSRYLRPLFFIGKGQGLNRIVHRKVLEDLEDLEDIQEKADWTNNWRSEKIFKNPRIQERLLTVEGVVRNYRVYATVGGTEIEVNVNLQNNLWKPRQVFFYLGFTIRGPVAFGIQTKTEHNGAKVESNSKHTKPGSYVDHTKLKSPSSFTPEVQKKTAQISYSFRNPGPGLFECTLTGLVFDMAQKTELSYRTIQWDERLLQSAGKRAAGPLFNISCSSDALCHLHLPHCETNALFCEGLLSVVHISDDGMSILEPLKITDTHVIVKVPHLSAFGLVWNILKWVWNNTNPVKGQVLLFLRPRNPKRQSLNVFLLPSNIPLEEVTAKQRQSCYIQTPSNCKLIRDQSYTVHCTQALKVQPLEEEFDPDFGPNYHPTFEICLPINTEEVTVSVRDQTNSDVWKRDVDLTGPDSAETTSVLAETKLMSVRAQFVKKVSKAVLDQLLDKLLERGLMNDNEIEFPATMSTTDKAREVIDMVRRKGSRACQALITDLCEVDSCLSRELQLF